MTKAADDFSEIARRMREISGDTPAGRQDVKCRACDGSGWVLYNPSGLDPRFIPCGCCRLTAAIIELTEATVIDLDP